jgi:monoamine oxidase
MPRTPLFAAVVRALRLADHAVATTQPTADVVERWQAASAAAVTRRQFVSVLGATGAVAALDACAPRRPGGAPPPGTTPRVVIVGGGMAGLTAAYRLRAADVPVRVFEAQERVGGRMFSLRGHFADAQVAELGGELIDTNQAHIQQLARELGIELEDYTRDDPAVSRDVWYFDGQRRTDAEVVEAMRPVAEHVRRDLAAMGDDEVTFEQPSAAAVRLDRQTLAQWLDAAGVTGWPRRLLDVAYETEYGLAPGDQSALNLLTMFTLEDGAFVPFGESDERFHVVGGNDRIVHTLAQRLGGAVETGVRLEAVRARGDGGFRCDFRRGTAALGVDADVLLLAIPFTLLRQVRLDLPLPAWKRRAIDELTYGTNAKLMVGFSERVWRTRHRSNGSVFTDLPFQATWETSRLQGGASGILTNFTGGPHGVALGAGTPAEQAARLVADLERVFPGVAAARTGMREARFHWPSHEFTRGSYASYSPGQWTALRGAEGRAVGRLHFAGEHCSLDAQGFMEGACETGERAATEILAQLGVRAPARLIPPGGLGVARPPRSRRTGAVALA